MSVWSFCSSMCTISRPYVNTTVASRCSSRAGLQDSPRCMDESEIKAMLKNVDREGTGKIDSERFIAIFEKAYPSWSHEDIRSFFRAAAVDGTVVDADGSCEYNKVLAFMFDSDELSLPLEAVEPAAECDSFDGFISGSGFLDGAATRSSKDDNDMDFSLELPKKSRGSICGSSHKYMAKEVIVDTLAQRHTILIDGGFFVEALRAGGTLLSRQEVEENFPHSVVSSLRPEEIWAMATEDVHNGTRINMKHVANAQVLLVAISYGWLAKDHPDPESHHLRIIAGVIKHFLRAFRHHEHRIAVFIDYASLFQNLPGQPRTALQRDSFHQGLQAVDLWYTHETVQVWALTNIPDSAEYSVGYDERGWTTFERLVSLFLSATVFDFGELDGEDPANLRSMLEPVGDHLFFSDVLITCKSGSSMVPPMLPHQFDELIDGKIFTNGKVDKPFVKSTYKETFYAVMKSAVNMSYGNKGWQDADVFMLAEVIKCCPHLKELILSANKIGDASVVPCIGNCPHLTSLKLDRTEITDATAALLADLSRLVKLSLSGTAITDASAAAIIRNGIHLRVLELGDTNVTDASLGLVARHCPNITKLNLRNTGVTDYSMSLIAQKCCEIERLHLDGTNVSDGSICHVALHCPNIEKLNLERTNVSDTSVRLVAENCVGLIELQLNKTAVSDDSISVVAQNASGLRHLKLSHTNVTDASIALLGKNCPQIRALSLGDTKVSDASLGQVALSCKKLAMLHVPNTGITDHSIDLLAEHCRGITTLDLRNAEVNDKALDSLYKNCKFLTSLVRPDGTQDDPSSMRQTSSDIDFTSAATWHQAMESPPTCAAVNRFRFETHSSSMFGSRSTL